MAQTSRRVLVVEDNPAMANVIRFNLQRGDFDVKVAVDGANAVRLLKQERFDLLFTDLQMPHMSGEELCRYVRRDPAHADMHIVVCSAKGLEIDIARLVVELHFDHVLSKPFSPAEVVSVVESILERVPVVP